MVDVQGSDAGPATALERGRDGSPDSTPLGRFRDQHDRVIQLRRYGDGPVPDDFEALVALYRAFDPTLRSSGVPPVTEPEVRHWLEVVLAGDAIVAWHESSAVGHVVLLPDGDRGYELAIFVHQDYHRCGLGRRLVGAMLAVAGDKGITRVGMLTTGSNRPMLELAFQYGFVVTSNANGQVELSVELPPARREGPNAVR